MKHIRASLLKRIVIPSLRKGYPFLPRLLNAFGDYRFPLRLHDRFFLSRHLLSGKETLQFDPSDLPDSGKGREE